MWLEGSVAVVVFVDVLFIYFFIFLFVYLFTYLVDKAFDSQENAILLIMCVCVLLSQIFVKIYRTNLHSSVWANKYLQTRICKTRVPVL